MALVPQEFDLHFYTDGTVAAWRKFCVLAGILPESAAKARGPFAKSFVVVEQKGRRWEAIFGQVHTTGEKRQKEGLSVHWHLDWHRSAGEPPARVVEMNEAVGGHAGLFASFLSRWPKGATRVCDGDFSCRFSGTREDAGGLPWPESKQCIGGSGLLEFRPSAVDWELTPQVGSISAIHFAPDGAKVELTASGPWRGDITVEALDQARGRANEDLLKVLDRCRT